MTALSGALAGRPLVYWFLWVHLRDVHWFIGFFGMNVKNWMDDSLREGWVPSERMVG
jgi:hypothetical protein